MSQKSAIGLAQIHITKTSCHTSCRFLSAEKHTHGLFIHRINSLFVFGYSVIWILQWQLLLKQYIVYSGTLMYTAVVRLGLIQIFSIACEKYQKTVIFYWNF